MEYLKIQQVFLKNIVWNVAVNDIRTGVTDENPTDTTTSITNYNSFEGLNLYPNPVLNTLNISLDNKIKGTIIILNTRF